MLSGSIRGSTRLIVPNRILPYNVLLQNEFYSCEEIPATKQAHRTTAQIPSKMFPKFHILLWVVLISFYLANISSVLTPWLGPLWRLFTFTLTHAAHLALGRAPGAPGSGAVPPYCTLGLQLTAATHIGADPDCVCCLSVWYRHEPPSFISSLSP